MQYRIVHRKTQWRKVVYWSMLFELAGTVVCLVLFALAQPDTYRTILWTAGNQLGFNSSPNIALYAYANHVAQPTIPFVWSVVQTNFNVAISVLSLFVLVVKMTACVMHIWYPLLALLFNVGMTALYTTSTYGQMGPDYADPNHPSPIAWYIAKPCTVAANQEIQKYCRMAKGTFAATVYMLFLYTLNLAITIWSLVPNKDDKRPRDVDSDEESQSPASLKRRSNNRWEMSNFARTPRTPRQTMPFTPRTMAFNTLDRKVPLLSEQSPR